MFRNRRKLASILFYILTFCNNMFREKALRVFQKNVAIKVLMLYTPSVFFFNISFQYLNHAKNKESRLYVLYFSYKLFLLINTKKKIKKKKQQISSNAPFVYPDQDFNISFKFPSRGVFLWWSDFGSAAFQPRLNYSSLGLKVSLTVPQKIIQLAARRHVIGDPSLEDYDTFVNVVVGYTFSRSCLLQV